jgi:hypothetical protein
MIDIFTVVLPHVLMAIAIWRLLHRDDLDQEPTLPGYRREPLRRKTKTPLRGDAPPGA